MKLKKRKLSGKLLGVIQFCPRQKQTVRFFSFAGVFSFVTAALISCRTKNANRKKKLHLNLTCLYLSVIFPDEFSTLLSPLTIRLWHIPQLEKEPKLSIVILDDFFLRLFPRIFFKKLMIASFCSKRSHAFQRNENLLFIHCDVM